MLPRAARLDERFPACTKVHLLRWLARTMGGRLFRKEVQRVQCFSYYRSLIFSCVNLSETAQYLVLRESTFAPLISISNFFFLPNHDTIYSYSTYTLFCSFHKGRGRR